MEIFALVILLVLVATGLAAWALLGMYPGKIARERNHPQADAIAVCGWWGAITLGLLTPLAFIWAYTNPSVTLTGAPAAGSETSPADRPAPEGEA